MRHRLTMVFAMLAVADQWLACSNANVAQDRSGQGGSGADDAATGSDGAAVVRASATDDGGPATAYSEGGAYAVSDGPTSEASSPSLADSGCSVASTMCGPPDRPCNVTVDEVITPPSPLGGTSAGAISLAVGASSVHVLFGALPAADASQAAPGLFYASRGSSPGSWSTEMSPMVADWGTLFLATDGTPRALVSGIHPTIWTRTNGTWQQSDVLTSGGYGGGWPWNSVADGTGQLHALVGTYTYVRWAGSFTTQTLAGRGAAQERGSIALSSSASAQFAYWGSGDGSLTWQDASGTTEVVAPWGSNVVQADVQPIALGVTRGAAEQPAVLFPRLVSGNTPQAAVDLAYATREAPSVWTIQSVATGDPTEFAPTHATAQNPYSYTTYRPVSVLADDAGGVRVLYAQYDVVGSIGCEGAGGGYACFGTPTSITAKLHVGWTCAGTGFSDAVVASDLHPSSVAGSISPAVLSADEAIHVAVAEASTPGGSPTGRYLVFSP